MRRKFPLELLAWLGGLILLAFTDPHLHHFSLCPLEGLGISWCPGCGLGRSISSLLHLDIINSFRYHWFGIPAFFILVHRIFQLSRKNQLIWNH